MELTYTCIGAPEMKPIRWDGHIHLLKASDPSEMEVTARGSSFHILCGRHKYGSFICIPNWNIGTELAGLADSFWNQERLTTYYPALSPVDVISIVDSLAVLNEYISLQEEAG